MFAGRFSVPVLLLTVTVIAPTPETLVVAACPAGFSP
jgi:hypothetical protein